MTKIIEQILHTDFLVSEACKNFGIGIPGLSRYAICKSLN
jgi:hypothetical protein